MCPCGSRSDLPLVGFVTTPQLSTRKLATWTLVFFVSAFGVATGTQAGDHVVKVIPRTVKVASARAHATQSVPPVSLRRAPRTAAKVQGAAPLHLANIAAQPSFVPNCSTHANSTGCIGLEVEAINNARAVEGLVPMRVSLSNFARLTGPEQILASTNLERMARGLTPVTALTKVLNAVAAKGAKNSTDPELDGQTLSDGASVLGWGSNWAGGLSVLEAQYIWIYDDGVGYNIDCANDASQGCWGHRYNVLVANPTSASCARIGGSPELLMGAALNPMGYHGSTSIAEIFVQSCGNLPADSTVTWQMVSHALRTGTFG